MTKHEQDARELHKMGNNCSTSLHNAYKKDTNLTPDFPAPRSIDGKCGALLTGIKILNDMGKEDKVDEFEKAFEEKFKYTKCLELKMHRISCNDLIGGAAEIIDSMK